MTEKIDWKSEFAELSKWLNEIGDPKGAEMAKDAEQVWADRLHSQDASLQSDTSVKLEGEQPNFDSFSILYRLKDWTAEEDEL